MSLTVLFTPPAMTADQYDDVIRRLEDAGEGVPTGRRYHIAFGNGSIRVVDIWESQEDFDRFAGKLMPLLGELGIDPGHPSISRTHNVIPG